MRNKLYIDSLQTPLGDLEITANEDAVVSILFVNKVQKIKSSVLTVLAKDQLSEYFDGTRESFDIPMTAAGTEFQKKVWKALLTVAYGETCSYGDIAEIINNKKAVRAVGAANGKNPMTIVVPCHRVIGQNGSLTGYASGVERKAWLLNHEARTLF